MSFKRRFSILLLLLFLAVTSVRGSLFFNASSEQIDHGTSLQINDPFTICVWVKPSNVDANLRQMIGQNKTSGTARLTVSDDSGSGVLRGAFPIAPSGLINAESVTGTTTSNEWQFFCYRLDTLDSQDMRLYRGTLTTIVTEVSYASTTNGTAQSNNASAFIVGRDVAGGFPCNDCDISLLLVAPSTALTVGQMKQQQFRSHCTADITHIYRYGNNGAGTQVNECGNGDNGTVTGATQSDNAPLPQPF